MSKNQKIGQLILSMRLSLFNQEHLDQAFLRALRSIASTRTFPTLTRWKGVTKDNPRTGFPVKEALVAKEKEEKLSSSTTTVRKEEKGNRKAKAKAVEKVLDVAKAKEAKEKWVKEKRVNLPSAREALLSAISVWR
jgi:hypothetical protein